MRTGNTDDPALIRAAKDKGVKLFATSEYYHNGNNEKMLGEVFNDRPRDSFYIMTGTNGGLEIDYKNGLFKPGTDPDTYLESANGCLKRLQVEYVDFFSLGFLPAENRYFMNQYLRPWKNSSRREKQNIWG